MISVSDGLQAPTDPDRPIVERIVAGDEQALRELMEARTPKLRGWLATKRGYFFTSEDLDEVVSKTFLCFWRTAARFEFRCTVKTYLGSIARNLMLNRIKYNQRFRPNRTTSLDVVHDSEVGEWTFADILTDGSDLRTAIDHTNQERDVASALDRLDEGPRQILHLRCVDNRDYYQIAIALGIPLGTVKSRISRARQALREEMQRQAA